MGDESRRMESEIDELMRGYRELRHNLQLMQEEILQVQATAYSQDGLVVVTVGPQGHLLGIRIDPLVNRRSGTDELSASIVEAVQAAAAMAAEQVSEITQRYAPDRFDHEELADFDLSSLLGRQDARLLEGR